MKKNKYLTGSGGKAIVDFFNDHEELYDKTNKHFSDNAGKDCLWERFARSHNLSVTVCMTSPSEMTERQNWIQDKLIFFENLHQEKQPQQIFRLQVPTERSQC